jgi:sugar O-acyltransferase (sialic acid O-acetyltransferase NeuD family)
MRNDGRQTPSSLASSAKPKHEAPAVKKTKTDQMCKNLLMFGGSGHAKDTIHIAKAMGYRNFKIVTSDGSCDIAELSAMREDACLPENYKDWDCTVAIGDNTHRRRFFETYPSLRFVSIIAPSADISETAKIAAGCYIGAHAYIGPDSNLEQGCIVNTHSIVGHDSTIGAYSQVGPKVCISGNVAIGESVFIGAGATLNNGSTGTPLSIPKNVHIGMGCIITHSIKHEGIRLIPKPNYIAVK